MNYVNTKVIISTENTSYGVRLASQLQRMELYAITQDSTSDKNAGQEVVSGRIIAVSDKPIRSYEAGVQKIILTSGNIQADCIACRDEILYVSKSIGITAICSLIKFISESDNTEKKAERAAAEMVRSMGIPVHLKGYRYLITAIVMTALHSEPDSMGAAELYERIAKIYRVQVSSVERAIRHSIEIAYDRCPEALKSTFSYPISKPNNTELILYAADTIRLWVL